MSYETIHIHLGSDDEGKRRKAALQQFATARAAEWGGEPSVGRALCNLADEIVLVTSIETRPELDPYHRDTGQATTTALYITPTERRVCITQSMDQGAVDADIWHHRVIEQLIESRPDETEAEAFLISPAGQALLARICDGHTIEWDGHNMVGEMNDDAHAALEQLIHHLENEITGHEWGLYDVRDYIQYPEEIGITATTTDAEIEKIATELDADAEAEWYIIYGDIIEYLTEARDEMRGETC